MANVFVLNNSTQTNWQENLNHYIDDNLHVILFTKGDGAMSSTIFERAKTMYAAFANVTIIKVVSVDMEIKQYLQTKLRESGRAFADGVVAFSVSMVSNTVVNTIKEDEWNATDKMRIHFAYTQAIAYH